LFFSKIHTTTKAFSFILFIWALTFVISCQSSASSCGNEVHKVAPKKTAGGGTKSCGNETHKVKKKKKVKKNKMGLFGKGENPYRRK